MWLGAVVTCFTIPVGVSSTYLKIAQPQASELQCARKGLGTNKILQVQSQGDARRSVWDDDGLQGHVRELTFLFCGEHRLGRQQGQFPDPKDGTYESLAYGSLLL